MIGKISGTIDSIYTQTCIIDVSGVGYVIYTPQRTLSKLKSLDKKSLYTHLHVRDDALDLFGFESKEELELFKMLITVSGIGPKTALLVMDKGVLEIRSAVSKSDVNFFTGIPRLGTKNAQKIIIELKNKIGSVVDLDLSGITELVMNDVINALSSMGFKKAEIVKSMKFITEKDITIEQKIKTTLKHLGKR
jgi:holliday junction DNA helicase RuvA